MVSCRKQFWHTRWFRRTAVVLLTVFLLASFTISVNEAWGFSNLPTWRQLFVAMGLQEQPLTDDRLQVTFFDVGNADCILVQNGDHALLIDAGEHRTANEVVEQLHLAGVEALDFVIATHADSDHIGGMEAVAREFEIGTFFISSAVDEDSQQTQVYRSLMTTLQQQGITVAEPWYRFTGALGKATLEILSGRDADHAGNEGSVVCRVCFGEHVFLMMGDAGVETENSLILDGVDLRADVLKVGHHGSSTATSSDFIRLVQPTYAVIPCGIDNSMGHPHAQTLETLRESNVTVYRSDYHGTVTFTSNGTALTVATQR